MYKHFYNFNIDSLIKIRLHLGHRDEHLNFKITPYLYGTRHNINIYNLDKLWKPYRYLYYGLVQNFARRNTFFLVGTNPHLPMSNILEKLTLEYPFTTDKHISFYISGYVDRKWIGGLFSNWKIFSEFVQIMENPNKKFEKRYKFLKYFLFLKGLRNLSKMPVPDFVVFLDQNAEALAEIRKMQIPMIGLVDTNMNPDDFVYKFWSNNDTFENIEFFFEFLKDTVKEGRLKEQQLFYYFFLSKLKKKLKLKAQLKLNRKKKPSLKILKKKPVKKQKAKKNYKKKTLKNETQI